MLLNIIYLNKRASLPLRFNQSYLFIFPFFFLDDVFQVLPHISFVDFKHKAHFPYLQIYDLEKVICIVELMKPASELDNAAVVIETSISVKLQTSRIFLRQTR